MCVIMFLKTLRVDVLQHQGIGRHSVEYVFTSNKNNSIMTEGTLVPLLCFHSWYVYLSHRFHICGSISWYVYCPTHSYCRLTHWLLRDFSEHLD